MAVAAGATFLGFAFDAVSGSELTSAFSAMYFLGCVLAVLAVRKRGLFTAVVQPPLLLFVAVPLGAQFLTDGAGTGLKDMAINVAYPLVNRFPLMLAATVVVGLIAAARVFLVQSRPSAPARPRDRRAEARPARARRARNDRTATRDDRTTVFDPVTDDRRAPTRAARPSRPAAEPASAHIPAGSPGNPYPGREGRAYEDTPLAATTADANRSAVRADPARAPGVSRFLAVRAAKPPTGTPSSAIRSRPVRGEPPRYRRIRSRRFATATARISPRSKADPAGF